MKKTFHIVVGVTGSIAAYKAAELVRRFKLLGWDVTVVMTRAATEFVGELTFRTLSQNPVGIEMFGSQEGWKPEHISWAERADAFVIAPCSANVVAKLAAGLADDLLTCTALATRAPTVVAPAMNVNMWDHPATQANLQTLRRRGVHVIDAAVGDLACGVRGKGRMVEVDAIVKVVEAIVKGKRPRGRAKENGE